MTDEQIDTYIELMRASNDPEIDKTFLKLCHDDPTEARRFYRQGVNGKMFCDGFCFQQLANKLDIVSLTIADFLNLIFVNFIFIFFSILLWFLLYLFFEKFLEVLRYLIYF